MLEDELMARDRWSRENLPAYQRQRVRALVLHALTHFVTDPQRRLADLRAHLANAGPSQSYLGAYRVATTSGTTGRRSIGLTKTVSQPRAETA